MKKFIRVTSTKNIRVTEGLSSIDMTNRDAHVADRFRVASAWTRTTVLIRKGTGTYPSAIKDWGSVKALVRDGVLTLGEESETTDDKDAQAAYDSLVREEKHYADVSEAAKKDAIVGTGDAPATKPGDVIKF
jgi:hypothetical protein